MLKLLSFFAAAGAAATLVCGATATAQTSPAGPIRIVVGFAPGGPPDTTARLVALRLEHKLNQPVVVENQVGASGTIAASAVARAKPDGRTLLFGTAANLAVAPATMRQPPYDPVDAFTPIVEVARGPFVWLVRADAPAANMREFIRWARERPGKLNYGTPGQGTLHHLATEMMKQSQGMYMLHVPYHVAPYTALLSGEIQGMFDSLPAPLALIETGRLRALGVTGSRRLAALPNVPTMKEQGLEDMEVNSWWGLVGPAGVPAATVAGLSAHIRSVLAEPEVINALAKAGIAPSSSSPEAFGRYIAEESARWRRVVKERSLNLD